MKSYLNNYIQTYFWQALAMVLHFASFLIVVPYLTENKVVYAIYSVCISISIFFNYADFGFVKSAVKYGGEYYIKKSFEDEKKLYGFTSFILSTVVSFIALTILLLSFNPNFIISDINNEIEFRIASNLLLILSIFSFSSVLQKYLDCVFQVRIEQYIFQKIKIIGNSVKIISVFYFFDYQEYDIVGYFLFIKIVDLVVQIFAFFIINKRYDFSFKDFFFNLKFDKKIFNKTKSLSLNSLYLTFTFIIYYELDLITVAKYLTIDQVANFSIAIFFIQFLRSLSSIILSPFQSRFNHFIGLNNFHGLSNFYKHLVKLILPFFVFSSVLIALYSKEIILTWIGPDFIEASIVISFFTLFFMLNFVNVPSGNLMISLERIKELYIINTIIPVFFWIGVYLTISYIDILSFALFKFLSALLASFFLINKLSNFLKINIVSSIFRYSKVLILPLLIFIIIYFVIKPYLPSELSITNFLIILLLLLINFLLGYFILFQISSFYKNEYFKYVKKIFNLKRFK